LRETILTISIKKINDNPLIAAIIAAIPRITKGLLIMKV
jgi:hypothetical protein